MKVFLREVFGKLVSICTEIVQERMDIKENRKEGIPIVSSR